MLAKNESIMLKWGTTQSVSCELPHTGSQGSHHQTYYEGEIRKKWRIWQGSKPVCLPINRLSPDKPRGTPTPLPPLPSHMPIAKPTSTCTKVEISINNANDMGIHPFRQSDASKLQQDISGKKRDLTSPDPGTNSQVIDSNTKDRKDRPLRQVKLINTKVC